MLLFISFVALKSAVNIKEVFYFKPTYLDCKYLQKHSIFNESSVIHLVSKVFLLVKLR
jgi:hypothetical protein